MRRADGRHRIKSDVSGSDGSNGRSRSVELPAENAGKGQGRWQPGPGHRPPSGQAIQRAASRRRHPTICSRLNPIRLGSGQRLAGRTWRARTNGIHKAYLFAETWVASTLTVCGPYMLFRVPMAVHNFGGRRWRSCWSRRKLAAIGDCWRDVPARSARRCPARSPPGRCGRCGDRPTAPARAVSASGSWTSRHRRPTAARRSPRR